MGKRRMLDDEGTRLLIEMLRAVQGRAGLGEWVRRGRCAEVDPELWFPAAHGPSGKAAAEICGGCEVREQCLAYAMEADEEFGVWGGLNRAERVRLAGRMREDAGAAQPGKGAALRVPGRGLLVVRGSAGFSGASAHLLALEEKLS